ncbi:MAG: hypothetical protein ACTSYD_12560 [Candidatus Heimdallarchaeaceae archaeon]
MSKNPPNSQPNRQEKISFLIRYKKSSFTMKISVLVTVLVLAFFLVYNLFLLFIGKWKDLSIHSIWVLFGWIFIAVFMYIIPNVISFISHYYRRDLGELQNQQIVNKIDERMD